MLDFCAALHVAVLTIGQVLMDSFALFFLNAEEAKHRDIYDDVSWRGILFERLPSPLVRCTGGFSARI